MTLTVVVGSSGSGKTTFLNDVYKSHKCTYIRQYHNIRPYVTVSKIPNFDPTKLPFWDIYVNEGKDKTIKAGGTMAGEFTAGLSGGQRKLLFFELVFQRIQQKSDLLIVLDEPFAGVTDDFVPFIVRRLEEIKERHNILLVTNDHIKTLKALGDNTITVSAIDRSTVLINEKSQVDREKAILALSVGDEYHYAASSADLQFFFDVEVANNGALMGVAIFTAFSNLLFLASFWDSDESSASLVLVAGSFISFFCLNPYLLALVDWRNFMTEEAEALLHASKSMNKILKSCLTLTMLLIVSGIQYGITYGVVDGLESASIWLAMLMDSTATTLPFLFFGLYTKLPAQAVQIFASLPFLLMLFFSTTFSPGAGVEVVKELRYLFPRFYYWCMVPDVQNDMENCPDTQAEINLYLVLTALFGLFLFLLYKGAQKLGTAFKTQKQNQTKNALFNDDAFLDLQLELYGDRILELRSTNHSNHSRSSSKHGRRSPKNSTSETETAM